MFTMTNNRSRWAVFHWLIGLAAMVVTGAAFLADGFVGDLIARQRGTGTTTVASFISRYSDWPVLLVALVAMGGLAHALGRQKVSRAIWTVVLAALLSGVTATSLRSVTGRTRPSATADQGFYGLWHQGECLIGKHKFNSFPSGHTATAAGVGGALLFLGWRLGVFGVLFALAVGWSRLILQCHHFSDTVASTVIGLAAGFYSVHVLRPLIAAWWRERLARAGQGEPESVASASAAH